MYHVSDSVLNALHTLHFVFLQGKTIFNLKVVKLTLTQVKVSR